MSDAPNIAMPTVWNTNNPNSFVQAPFPNANFAPDGSLGVPSNLKSPKFSGKTTVKNVSKYGDSNHGYPYL